MREQLIRYLLGELDEVEQRLLEERLRESAELRRELTYLRSCFSPNEASVSESNEPPVGLARRTAEQVTNLGDDESAATCSPSARSRDSVEPPMHAVGWSLADVSVAAGVILAVSMLLLPALRGSRDTARRNYCGNNKRELGYLFARFAGDNWGYFPKVEANDSAGIFAARLVDGEYIEADELTRLLVCPASKQGDDFANNRLVIRIPTVAELTAAKTARPGELDRLLKLMAFSYAYRLGYVEGNKYYCIRNQRRSCEPILADAPAFKGRSCRTANHGGCTLNVLYADGHVGYQKGVTLPGGDHLYLNLSYEPLAGQSKSDIVLATALSTPVAATDVSLDSSSSN